jgi:protease IV
MQEVGVNRRGNLIIWFVVGGAALLFFVLCLAALTLYIEPTDDWDLSLESGQIGLVEVEGLIYDPKPTVDLLKTYRKRKDIKALVVRINSPGGGAAASQEIFAEIRRFRKESGKKVVASLGSVAASGGYYVACGADKIVASPATITGSIGVIAEWINWGDLMAWAKLQNVVFKSGEFKDSGNPTRPMTDAEKRYFQGLIDGLYRQFVRDVAAGRGITVDQINPLADGRVFTGEEAQAKLLVDELGTLQDAVALAARLSNISGEPKLVIPKKKRSGILDILTGEASAQWPLQFDPSHSQIRFEYLWR